MTKCNKCKNGTLSKGNKSGLCRDCYRNKGSGTMDAANVPSYDIGDLNNGATTNSEQLNENIMNSALTELTVAGIMNLINIINQPLEEKLNDIRNDLSILTPRVLSLESQVKQLEEISVTQQGILHNHQKFVENLANKDRLSNLIITGLEKSESESGNLDDESDPLDDRSKVAKIIDILLPGTETTDDIEK